MTPVARRDGASGARRPPTVIRLRGASLIGAVSIAIALSGCGAPQASTGVLTGRPPGCNEYELTHPTIVSVYSGTRPRSDPKGGQRGDDIPVHPPPRHVLGKGCFRRVLCRSEKGKNGARS